MNVCSSTQPCSVLETGRVDQRDLVTAHGFTIAPSRQVSLRSCHDMVASSSCETSKESTGGGWCEHGQGQSALWCEDGRGLHQHLGRILGGRVRTTSCLIWEERAITHNHINSRGSSEMKSSVLLVWNALWTGSSFKCRAVIKIITACHEVQMSVIEEGYE